MRRKYRRETCTLDHGPAYSPIEKNRRAPRRGAGDCSESCAAFAGELVITDRDIAETLLVCVPEGLEHRVMVTRVYKADTRRMSRSTR